MRSNAGPWLTRVGAALLCGVIAGCAADDSAASAEATFVPEPLPVRPGAAPVRPSFCDRPGQDAIREVFCEGEPKAIRSLSELQERIELLPTPEPAVAADGTMAPAYPVEVSTLLNYVVALGHSTALSGHLVSPINPRAILLSRQTILTFQRGVQRIELATRAQDEEGFNFYLVSFVQACNERARGCSPGDLYTPRIESDWSAAVIEDDEDLKNTPQDCRQCHQRGR